MLRHTLRSLAGILWVIFLLSIFTFVLSRAVPGGPWDVGDIKFPLTDHQIALAKAKYGLDKPILEQYLIWLRNAVTFDFGSPYSAPEMSVTGLIMKQLPYSAVVGGLAAALALILGITLGMIAASKLFMDRHLHQQLCYHYRHHSRFRVGLRVSLLLWGQVGLVPNRRVAKRAQVPGAAGSRIWLSSHRLGGALDAPVYG